MVFHDQGTKRKAVSGYQSHDDSSDNSECSFPFKYAYGVNAWRHWVRTRRLEEDLLALDRLTPRKCSGFVFTGSCLKSGFFLPTTFDFEKDDWNLKYI